jgi:hypothetical protein
MVSLALAAVSVLELGSKLKRFAVFLSKSAIPVIAHSGGDAEVWPHLELVLGEEAGLLAR